MNFSKKSKKTLTVCIGVISMAVVLVASYYMFFYNNHRLLDVTMQCIAAYEEEGIYISGGKQEVSFDQLEFAVNRNLELVNGVENEYHKKYNALLKKEKAFYTLTDEECYELNFSAGTDEDVKWAKSDILKSGKSLQIWSENDLIRYSFADSPDELSPPPKK